MQDIIIRSYQPQDRGAVREIAWQTAFCGQPADIFFDDQEVLSDFLTLYFTDHEPSSSFVAEYQGEIVGYLTGARNAAAQQQFFLQRIAPRLFLKALYRLTLFRWKNIRFLARCLWSFLRGEFQGPDVSSAYPATLHINVKKGFRRSAVGSRLMAAYLNYLARLGVPGLRLATISEQGFLFFQKEGFNVISRGKRSYFRSFLGQDLPCYVLGKKIASSSPLTEKS